MNTSIEHLIRENIKKLVPYSSARSEYTEKEGLFLDANENPFGSHNRYPDPLQLELKEKLAQEKGIKPSQLFLANGSDGIVDVTYRVFCEPNRDKALNFPPTFGMYTVAANLNNVELLSLPLNDNFQIDRSQLEKHIHDENLKVIFVCSPNNPTGNHMHREEINYILDNFKGITVIDEAYIDFNERASYSELLVKYPRMVILQTMSKSWALAGARVGMAIMSEELITYYNKVKTPYNVSSIDQQAAMDALADKATFEQNLHTILSEKERVKKGFEQSKLIEKIYPSDTNFFLVKATDGEALYKQLITHKIVVRNQHRIIPNCLRITIGKPEENNQLLTALKAIEKELH